MKTFCCGASLWVHCINICFWFLGICFIFKILLDERNAPSITSLTIFLKTSSLFFSYILKFSINKKISTNMYFELNQLFIGQLQTQSKLLKTINE